MTLIDEYLEYQNNFEKKYGVNTIVLMEVGHFFEFYGIENDNENIGKVSIVGDLLNMIVTRKNKEIKEVSRKNPLMAGFPNIALERHVNYLIKNNYTVVLIEQVTEPPNPKREITKIISPSTYIDDSINVESNNCLSIHISKEKCYKTKKITNIIGLSVIDFSIGKSFCYQINGNPNDKDYSYEETIRFIQTFNPREIIITYNDYDKNEINNIINKLEITNNHQLRQDLLHSDIYKINYQKQFLKKIFTNTGLLNPIEYINLDKLHNTLISFMILLEFSYEHNENIIQKIEKPEIMENNKYLILENNAISQLNLINDTKQKSLYNIIDYTSTSIGKRKLKENLLMPIYNCDILNERYDNIFELSEKKDNVYLFNIIEQKLKGILDLERLHRKLTLNILNPFEFINLNNSYIKVHNLINYLNNLKSKLIPKKDVINNFNNYINEYNNDLNLDDCNFNLNEIKRSIFKKGIFIEVDNLQNDINIARNYMEIICLFFDNVIQKYQTLFITNKSNGKLVKVKKKVNSKGTNDNNSDNNKNNIDNNETNKDDNINNKKDDNNENDNNENITSKIKFNYCKIENNERDGYYILMTNKRFKLIKENIPNEVVIIVNYSSDDKSIYNYYSIEEYNKIKDNLDLNNKDILKLKVDEFITTIISSNIKINSIKMKENSKDLVYKTEQLKKICKKYFIELLNKYNDKYINDLKEIEKFIGNIDFIKSCAKASNELNYCKPNIVNINDSGYIKADELRHPIIERLILNKYIPNWVRLGVNLENDKLSTEDKYDDYDENDNNINKKMNGMLLFSCNSLGKSSYMKSVGLSIILAQIGMYVPAKNFTYYPFKSILTRIIGNDNIYKGLSSFAVEMSELRGILNRSDKNSLVLGDEICHGTEQDSGLALVASSLIHLHNKDAKFIFASHLHQLSKMNEINNLTNLKSFHLKVNYDEKNDTLVYDRTLCPGSGSSIYGIEVARAMDLDKEFINTANILRMKYSNISDKILNNNMSKYNSNLYQDKCEVCGDNGIDTHHIIFQSNANEDNMIDHRHKNHYSNLVILCKKCHNDVHNNKDNKLIINGYKETSNGRILDYYYTK